MHFVGAGDALARLERAETLTQGAVFHAPLYRQQRAFGMVAKRDRERNLILRRLVGRRLIGRAQPQKPLRQSRNRFRAILLAGLHDHRQRREAQRIDAQKAGAKRMPLLGFHGVRLAIGKQKATRNRPFAGLRRTLENERVGRIEPNRARQFQAVRLHLGASSGACKTGSYHSCASSACAREERSLAPPASVETRSPLTSIMRFFCPSAFGSRFR